MCQNDRPERDERNAALRLNDGCEAKSPRLLDFLNYAFDPKKCWYVIRASYGRAVKAAEYIERDGTEVYVPKRKVLTFKTLKTGSHAQRVSVMEPLLPNLFFVYTTPEKIDKYVRATPELHFVSYYYNHFKRDEQGSNPPLTVGYEEMMNFIRFVSVQNKNIIVVDPSEIQYKAGDMVRVVYGQFEGVEGRVVRYAGQQRVAMTLNSLCTVLTAYIPTAFLEKIEGK